MCQELDLDKEISPNKRLKEMMAFGSAGPWISS